MTASTHSEPKLESRAEQPCVAIPTTVLWKDFDNTVEVIPEVLEWLAQREIAEAGPLFFRYLVIGDMSTSGDRPFQLEIGSPIAAAATGDERVITGSIPAGTYATTIHHGSPGDLVETHAALHKWAADNGISFATSTENGEEVWHGRYEFYLSDPAEEPDMSKWSTEVAYLVAS